MDPLVFGLVALSSVFHVGWNALLKTAGDPLRTAAVGLTAAAAIVVPGAAIGWWISGRPAIPIEVLGLAGLSGCLEALYFVLLSNGYRRGDLSVVYPVARGSATLFAVAAGTLVLGERLGPVGWLGVGGLVSGLLLLRSPLPAVRAVLARGRRRGDRPASGPRPDDGPRTASLAIGFALATGLVIAAYSAVDRVASRIVEPWLYAGLLWAAMVPLLLGLVWVAGRSVGLARVVPPGGIGVARRRAAMGGLLTLAAYLLVLFAFSLAPLTAVAPLRESAVVLASGWGALRLRETAGRRATATRIGAAGLIVLGAVLLALES